MKKLMIGMAALIGSAALWAEAPATTTKRTDGLYISHVHRGGGAKERPDNTLETFLWCWGNGSALECDCRVTADGVGIMYHDTDLGRTPRGIPADWKKRQISKMKWEEIRDIDVGSYLSADYASQRIPTMQSVMAAMAGHPTYLLFVDEKGAGPKRIAEEAQKFGVLDQVYYTTWNYNDILKWADLTKGGKSLLWIGKFPHARDRFDPAKRPAMVKATRDHFEWAMNQLRKNNFKHVTAVSLHTYWNPKDPVDQFILGTDYLKKLIDEFHAHGVKVCSIPFEGGSQEACYHKLWELGCDGFSTDYPSVMFKVIRDLKKAEQ